MTSKRKVRKSIKAWSKEINPGRRTVKREGEFRIKTGIKSFVREFDVDEKVPDEERDLDDKILSGEFKWKSRTHRTDPGKGTGSSADSSIDDNSRNSGIDTYSDRNSSSGSELSELAIHTLLVETRARISTGGISRP